MAFGLLDVSLVIFIKWDHFKLENVCKQNLLTIQMRCIWCGFNFYATYQQDYKEQKDKNYANFKNIL